MKLNISERLADAKPEIKLFMLRGGLGSRDGKPTVMRREGISLYAFGRFYTLRWHTPDMHIRF